MADVVDLAGKQVVRVPSERAIDVQKVLEEVGQANAREEVRSIVVLTVNYDGTIAVASVREWSDDTAIIGQLELVKGGIVRRHWDERMEVKTERPV